MKKPKLKLICKKTINPLNLSCIKRAINHRRRNYEYYKTHFNRELPEIIAPDKIKKGEILEFNDYYIVGTTCRHLILHNFNMTEKELNEYFHSKLISSRILKLRKLKLESSNN